MRHEEDYEKRTAQRRAHYEREDVNGRLVINLRDIGHTLRDLSEGRGSQKRILILLLETGPITQRELTERLGIQPGSASEVIAKLENAGLVTRTESEADRRTVDIRNGTVTCCIITSSSKSAPWDGHFPQCSTRPSPMQVFGYWILSLISNIHLVENRQNSWRFSIKMSLFSRHNIHISLCSRRKIVI